MREEQLEEDAGRQLTRYLAERHDSTGHEYVGIATDGATFQAYALREDEHAELVCLAEQHDISIFWITRQAVTEFLERYGRGESRLALKFTETPHSANG